MKKIICLLVTLLLLCSCSYKNPKHSIDEYVKPLNEVNFYNELADDIKETLDPLYGSVTVNNNLLQMVDKKLTDLIVEDYYGNTINFNDYQDENIILEIVQYSCEHCLKQVPLTENIVNNEGITFIQYFAWGDKEQIDDFYDRANMSMSDKVIVIPQNDELSSYVTSLEVDSTPTFLFFNHSKLTFACIAELSYPMYQNIKEYAYKDNTYSINDFVNNEGILVFDLNRSYDDVLNDLSTINKDKLAKIDNSEEITVNVIGKELKLNELYEANENPIYTIDSYEKYYDKPFVVFYIGYIKNNLEKDVAIVNEFAEKHKDLNMLTILMDTKDLQTSSLFKDRKLKLSTDVVSSNAEIPKQFLDTSVVSYPAALFIQDNVFTGGCHSFASSETLERAYETFLGEESIALISNN